MSWSASTPTSGPRLHLRVTASAESTLRAGHPWLYAQSIREQNRPGKLGELVIIYDRKDKFLALGLFDPHSPLRVRVLQVGQARHIDQNWWSERLRAALHEREGVFDGETTGFRLINGESDGWPGLVLDRYDRTLVIKLYTAAWLPRFEEILQLVQTSLQPARIVLRLSRNIQKIAANEFARTDGQIIVGSPPEGPIVFRETGLQFESDVVRGQKTGFFLDQRENRRRVEALAHGRTMLNAFSFSGGFSLYAARGGAQTVTDLDISEHALASGERNFALNKHIPQVGRCRREAVRADAFDWLGANTKRKFGLIVLDPPSLAKREAERAGAIQAYRRLAAVGVKQLGHGGILVACSCSAHVTAPEFFSAVRQAAIASGRAFEEIATTGHAADHPATFEAAHYLKAMYCRLD